MIVKDGADDESDDDNDNESLLLSIIVAVVVFVASLAMTCVDNNERNKNLLLITMVQREVMSMMHVCPRAQE
jgi:hypothetical protein